MTHEVPRGVRASHDDEPDGGGLADLGWASDNVVLTTVGIDVGSTTSHLMFSRIHLQRSASRLTSRFTVINREVIHRSDVRLTPYLDDETIDSSSLGRFIEEAYVASGLDREHVDTGAVILTGAALERRNARRIAEIFAEEGGRFVCASAGHTLEATLAAHGSGAAILSARQDRPILNIDVGGGTTKYAVCRGGEVIATAAIGSGARLVAFDDTGRVVRLEAAALPIARSVGLDLALGVVVDEVGRAVLARRLAELIVRGAEGNLGHDDIRGHVLEGDLPTAPPRTISLSGGVGELYHRPNGDDHGDLGRAIALELRRLMTEGELEVIAPAEAIRATVVGASQFTVQVSGNTLYHSAGAQLPVHNLPVLAVSDESVETGNAELVRDQILLARRSRHLEESTPAVIAVRWRGTPLYERLRKLADGIAMAHGGGGDRPPLLAVACEADIAATLGGILVDELNVREATVIIDGLSLTEFDFIDIGALSRPANVIPVVVKSLMFAPEQAN